MTWKPGDIVNGHMLGSDGKWHPVTEPEPEPEKPQVVYDPRLVSYEAVKEPKEPKKPTPSRALIVIGGFVAAGVLLIGIGAVISAGDQGADPGTTVVAESSTPAPTPEPSTPEPIYTPPTYEPDPVLVTVWNKMSPSEQDDLCQYGGDFATRALWAVMDPETKALYTKTQIGKFFHWACDEGGY